MLEEGSSLNLVTGCVAGQAVNKGSHFSVSEQYVGKNASLTCTMIHRWGIHMKVRPRLGTIVDEGGVYLSNFVALQSAGDIRSCPVTWLNGKGASAKYKSIIHGQRDTMIETGGKVFLNAENTSAELVHRAVCTGGRICQRGLLVGSSACRAHVECAGLLLNPSDDGYIMSVPGLQALHPHALMSHEASIGRISPEQVQYLQTRGMKKHEAISLIIQGFLGSDIKGLGSELDIGIAKIAELAGHGE